MTEHIDWYKEIFGVSAGPEGERIQDAKAHDYEERYCTQNHHDCKSCSLVSYGLDRHNNPICCDNCKYYGNKRCKLWEIKITEPWLSYCESWQMSADTRELLDRIA